MRDREAISARLGDAGADPDRLTLLLSDLAADPRTATDPADQPGRDPVRARCRLAAGAIAIALDAPAAIWLLDEAGTRLVGVAGSHTDETTSRILQQAVSAASSPASGSLLGRALRGTEPVETAQSSWRELGDWDDTYALALIEAAGPTAFHVVRIGSPEVAEGVIVVARPSGIGPLDPVDAALVRLVAGDLGHRLHRADLTRRLETEHLARHAAQVRLEAARATVRAVARAGPVLLFALDRDGIFTVMDGGLLADLGQPPGGFVGRSFFSVYEDQPQLQSLGTKVLAGEPLRRVPVSLEGHDLEVFAMPLFGAMGEVDGAAGIVVDVSDRVAAEQAVVDAARRQTALVEHASDVVVVLGGDSTVRYVNPAAKSMFGATWKPGDILDLPLLSHPEDREQVLRHLAEALERPGSAPPVEFRLAHDDGSWRTVEAIVNNLLTDPAVEGFVVTLRDVTDRLYSELRLRANAARQAALADLGRWALVGLAFSSLVDDAVGVLAEQLDVDFVHVFEALPDSAFLSLRASHGHGPAGPELLSTEPTSSPVSFALVTQEPVVCADLALEARFEIPELWTRSEAMSVVEVPIPGQDSPAGVLGVGCRSPHEFAAEDVNFVIAVANVLAAAAARNRAEGAIREQALQDPLTGLPNRLVLADHGVTAAAPKPSEPIGAERTILVLDIDRFKEINDTLGHALGDLVLLEVAGRLRGLGDPFELVARLGGDEFAVVATSALALLDPEAMAARLLAALAEAIDVGGVRLRLRGSVGIATPAVDEAGEPLATSALLRRAEVAMYQAKADRRGIRRYSDDLERSSVGRLALASELADAVDRDELHLDYQPKVDALTGAVTGAEALVRWRHPTRGLLLPDMFVPLAEQTGMIRELTNWVLEKALSECAAWHQSGYELPVAINLSASTVHDPELLDAVTSAVRQSGLRPEAVELEITESAVMLDPDGALRSLQALVDHGIRLSLDDFGTGYSSLSYLQRLPVTAVKIDKSFVEPLLRDEAARAIVHSVIELSHNLDLSVIAEGVDSAAVLEQLTALGCDALQGFHVAIPMNPQRLERWIAAHSPGARPPLGAQRSASWPGTIGAGRSVRPDR